MFRPYSYYKTNVDLVQYLLKLGFSIDKGKSSRSCAALRDENGGVILVRRNSDNQEYFYTNPLDSTDKGNIVDFIAKRKGLDKKLDFELLNKLLAEAAGMPHVETKYFSHTNVQASFQVDLLVPLVDYRYLIHRGLEQSLFSQNRSKAMF